MHCVKKMKRLIVVAAFAATLLLSGTALAGKSVRFVNVGWTGVTVKTELGVNILKSLGYDAENLLVSVPIAYKAMSMNEADVFLGNWMPSMQSIAQRFFDDGSVVNLVANMTDAKYTLAVPAYVQEAGLKDFSDIAKYADKLDHKIYGIEEGNDGNEIIQAMIDKDMFGLGGFELVPSSEAGMLAQVQDAVREKRWIVFLGWAPHSMNERIDMRYLTGSTAETFGGNDGTATVYTNVRAGFPQEMPNVTRFLKNFTFPVSMMNQIMTEMSKSDNLGTEKAGLQWVKRHPEIYRPWFEGVTTADGKPALPAFEKRLAEVE
jgi:glycine betaine/proline transport system substrate-binding protein